MTNTQITVISFLLCLVIIVDCIMLKSQNYSNKNKKQKSKETNKVICGKKICSECEIGKLSYELDMNSDFCPYINSLEKGECKAFIPIEKK